MIRVFSNIWDNFKEYIILVVLIILSLIILSFNNNAGVKTVRAAAFGTFASVTSVFTDVFSSARLRNENARLREVNAELMLQVSRLRQYGLQNDELKGLLNLRDSVKYPLYAARIVSKTFSSSQSTITLNIGSAQNVRPGMPVINDQGLLGIIYSTSEDYSIARTLKHRDLKLTVKDERSRIDGIMKWNGEDLVIIDVPKTYDVETGDKIITSELSSLVAVPVPVGTVIGLSKVQTGIFNEVKIKPLVDFSRAENVFVLGIVESKQKNDLELNFFNRNK